MAMLVLRILGQKSINSISCKGSCRSEVRASSASAAMKLPFAPLHPSAKCEVLPWRLFEHLKLLLLERLTRHGIMDASMFELFVLIHDFLCRAAKASNNITASVSASRESFWHQTCPHASEHHQHQLPRPLSGFSRSIDRTASSASAATATVERQVASKHHQQ